MAVLAFVRTAASVTIRFAWDGAASVSGEVPVDRVRAWQAQVARALEPAPQGLMLRQDDLAWAARERAAAGVVVGLFGDPGLREVSESVARFKAVRGTQGVRAWLALELDPSLHDLPWELLALLPDTGPGPAGCAVVRLVAGPAARVWRGVPRVVCTSPTPSDPVCAEALVRVAAAAGSLTRTSRGAPEVLHLVAHGLQRADGAGLEGDREGARGDGALADALHGRSCVAVVLDVCGAADAGREQALAGAIAARGLDVVAPRGPLDAEAAAVFHGGLYGAMRDGARWLDAVEAGRAALRARGWPERHGRWWVVTAWVTRDPDTAVDAERPPARGRRAVGWGAAALLGLAGGAWALWSAPAPAPVVKVLDLTVDEDGVVALPLPVDVVVSAPKHGRIRTEGGGRLYVPDPDFAGTEALHVQSDTVTGILVRVRPVNDPPRISGVVDPDDDRAVVFEAADPDSDLTWTVSLAGPGALEGAAPRWRWSVPDGQAARAVVTAVVSDGEHQAEASVTLAQTGRPAAPKAPPPGTVVVQPRQRAEVRVAGGPWHAASGVMPWTQPTPAGTRTIEARTGTGQTVQCEVAVPSEAEARVCPDVRTGRCACGG